MTYYIAVNRVKKDPLPEEKLRAMIAAGEVGADAMCWREGWSNWQPVATAFPDLFPGYVPPAPTVDATPAAAHVDAEAVRKEYLNHEASLRSVGVLYILGALLMIVGAVSILFGLSSDDHKKVETVPPWAIAVIIIPLSALYFTVGRWLRALNPKARTPATILAALGLLGFPLGTLLNAYILYLLRSKKGAMVFSESYREVVAATPHIKYKTSLVIWILVGLVVLILACALIAPLLGSHRG